MSTDPRSEHRLDELLALEATQGLTPAEATELDALLASFPGEDPDGFERAAAAVHLALSGPLEPLPAHLAERLELAAAAFTPPARPATPKGKRPAYTAWAGWAVAACLAGVLVLSFWRNEQTLSAQRNEASDKLSQLEREVTTLQTARKAERNEAADKLSQLERQVAALSERKSEPTVAQKRDELLKDASAKAVAFEGDNKATATGTVVWSNSKQEGYLEVRGLPALNPKTEQYQLWIVDPAHKEPVDGGVFDVKHDGTALVRVRNPILVREAKAFAITKEVVGGVPVSKQPKHELVLIPKQG